MLRCERGGPEHSEVGSCQISSAYGEFHNSGGFIYSRVIEVSWSSRAAVSTVRRSLPWKMLPVLQSWWAIMGMEKLGTFQDKVPAELHRREQLLSAQTGASESEYDGPGQRLSGRIRNSARHMIFVSALTSRQRSRTKAIVQLTTTFVTFPTRWYPNICRTCYLFNVPNLEGLIPRMNQVYLRADEQFP